MSCIIYIAILSYGYLINHHGPCAGGLLDQDICLQNYTNYTESQGQAVNKSGVAPLFGQKIMQTPQFEQYVWNAFKQKKTSLFKFEMVQTLGTRFIASCNGDDTKPNNLIDDCQIWKMKSQIFGWFLKILPQILKRQEKCNISLLTWISWV